MKADARTAVSASAGASGYSLASGDVIEVYTSIFDQLWLGISGGDWVQLAGAALLCLTIIERILAIKAKLNE